MVPLRYPKDIAFGVTKGAPAVGRIRPALDLAERLHPCLNQLSPRSLYVLHCEADLIAPRVVRRERAARHQLKELPTYVKLGPSLACAGLRQAKGVAVEPLFRLEVVDHNADQIPNRAEGDWGQPSASHWSASIRKVAAPAALAS